MPVLIGVFGSLIGSFLNVVIFRVPAGRSIVAPPSACGSCGARIRPYDNVPVISWLLLRGRCRDCGDRISMRYPLVELFTALAFTAVALWVLDRWGTEATSLSGFVAVGLALSGYLYFVASSIALALIDLDTHRLPNRIVVPLYLAGILLLGSSALLTGDVAALLRMGLGMAGLWAVYALLALAYPGGMGYGDVKLAGALGLFLGFAGWGELAIGAFAAFVLGGLFSIGLLIARRATRRSGIPFGPWMLGGAWIGLVAGGSIASAYLTLIGVGR